LKRAGPPQRRTPLNPGSKGLAAGKPLARGKPLTTKAGLQRGGPVPQMSDKRKGENAERRKLGGPARCEIRDVLLTSRQPLPTGTLACCGPLAWHERRFRSAGGSITNPANLLGACSCHNELASNAADMCRQLFGSALVVREGDPEYESLGTRIYRRDRSP
jgi:hypothetical protein